MFTSVADFSRFAIAFLNGGRVEGRQILSPAVIAKLSTPYVDVPSGNIAEHPKHGYGLNVRDYRGVRASARRPESRFRLARAHRA